MEYYSYDDEEKLLQCRPVSAEELFDHLAFGRLPYLQSFQTRKGLDWVWRNHNDEWCITQPTAKQPQKMGKYLPYFMTYLPWKSLQQFEWGSHYYFGLPHLQDDPSIAALLWMLPGDLLRIIRCYYRCFYEAYQEEDDDRYYSLELLSCRF